MKLSRWLKALTIVVLCLPLILLAPGGFCFHLDGSSCVEGPGCCDESSDPGKSCDVCQDLVPESASRQHPDSAGTSHKVLATPVALFIKVQENSLPTLVLMDHRAKEEPDRSYSNIQRIRPLLC